MERKKLFTIGQFAKLHHINKKTLMWYDEIGLFKPALIHNKYRYYTYHQSQMLETIRILRELDMSIPEIKEFLDHRSTEAYVELLHKKTADVDQKISRLRNIRETLTAQEAQAVGLLRIDCGRIDLIEREEEYFYLADTDKDQSLEADIENILQSMEQHGFQSLHDTTYGALISVFHLNRAEFEEYDALFIKVSHPSSPENLHVKPKGTYLRAYCKGSWDKLPKRYEEIFAYARQRDLILSGYSYETGLNEMTITSQDDYLTQIEILVENPPYFVAGNSRPKEKG